MGPGEMVRTRDKNWGVEEVVFAVTKTMIVDEIVQGWWELLPCRLEEGTNSEAEMSIQEREETTLNENLKLS